MTRKNCVWLFDLALAIVSIGLFVVTLVSLAHHSLDSLDAIFLENGTALGAWLRADSNVEARPQVIRRRPQGRVQRLVASAKLRKGATREAGQLHEASDRYINLFRA